MDNFGDRLRMIRNNKNMTLDALANECDTSATIIRNYEKSRKKPNIVMLIKICEALKVSPDILLQDELSFNPFEANGEMIKEINRLSPSQINLVKDFIASLQKHSSE